LYSICKQYEEMVLLPTCEKKLKFWERGMLSNFWPNWEILSSYIYIPSHTNYKQKLICPHQHDQLFIQAKTKQVKPSKTIVSLAPFSCLQFCR
jgi:hypothetical protein